MNSKLSGKWALVTGSSRGIGQQIALGLAQHNANVIIHGRKKENVEKTFNLIKPYGVTTRVAVGDLETDKGIQAIINTVKENPGHIDILYNNAAINTEEIPILDCGVEEWLRIFRVNVFAMVQLCNAFIPEMKKRGYGRIINLTSCIANKPEFAAYSVSKAAVDKYSRDLSYALRDTNVLVNYLDPGWIKTEMGGKEAWYDVETVVPGALIPALFEDNGPSGRFFHAQDFKYLK